MIDGLEDARQLAHGTYDDVIVVEHRKPTGATAAGVHVVLELPERSRVIDKGQAYEIDGVVGEQPPTIGISYRLVVAASERPSSTAAVASTSLRYEITNR